MSILLLWSLYVKFLFVINLSMEYNNYNNNNNNIYCKIVIKYIVYSVQNTILTS